MLKIFFIILFLLYSFSEKCYSTDIFPVDQFISETKKFNIDIKDSYLVYNQEKYKTINGSVLSGELVKYNQESNNWCYFNFDYVEVVVRKNDTVIKNIESFLLAQKKLKECNYDPTQKRSTLLGKGLNSIDIFINLNDLIIKNINSLNFYEQLMVTLNNRKLRKYELNNPPSAIFLNTQEIKQIHSMSDLGNYSLIELLSESEIQSVHSIKDKGRLKILWEMKTQNINLKSARLTQIIE